MHGLHHWVLINQSRVTTKILLQKKFEIALLIYYLYTEGASASLVFLVTF